MHHASALAGFIARSGGPTIQEESNRVVINLPDQELKTGSAVATGAGTLPFKKIIHTVGPVWQRGGDEKVTQLKSSVNECLEVAGLLKLQSLAIPAISSGVHGFPRDLCAHYFIQQVLSYA